jgi:hypothetical protein
VVGGTGMLAEASRHIANDADCTSLFARSEASLQALRNSLPASVHAIATAVDYRLEPGFAHAVCTRIGNAGVPQLVLAWFHDTRPALALATQLSDCSQPVRFFHVLGSASANPAASLRKQRMAFDALPCLTYHQIVLGFVRGERGSRWLTHAEISAGVIQALQLGLRCHIVGVVEPWDARP